jgi:putative hydrolase of the HAD superfamily
LGGVVALDFSCTDGWAQLKRELKIPVEKYGKFEAFWDAHEPEVCAGKDVESLMPLLKKEFGSEMPKGYSLLRDGFVSRFKPNEHILPVIEKARKARQVGLLTNMYPGMLDEIMRRGIAPKDGWNAVVDSSVVGAQKPEPEIFRIAEGAAKVRGGSILFIDNSVKNVDAAKRFGWETFLYDPNHAAESSKSLSALL